MDERRATVRLSADELREAKVAAARSDMSLQKFVVAAIREKVEKGSSKMDPRFVNVVLTEQEMVDLDDGQDWYKSGDSVLIAGYFPDASSPNPSLDLAVNGVTRCENWISWSDVPDSIRARMS